MPIGHLEVEDVVHLIMVLVIYFKGGWTVRALSGEGVWGMFFEELDVEHEV